MVEREQQQEEYLKAHPADEFIREINKQRMEIKRRNKERELKEKEKLRIEQEKEQQIKQKQAEDERLNRVDRIEKRIIEKVNITLLINKITSFLF